MQTHQGQQGREVTPAELKEPVCSHTGHILDDVEQLLCTLQTDTCRLEPAVVCEFTTFQERLGK